MKKNIVPVITPMVVIFLVIFSGNSMSLEKDKYWCGKIDGSNLQIRDCYESYNKEQDGRLNQYYKKIMSLLNKNEKEFSEEEKRWGYDGAEAIYLRDAQRAWIKFRDNNCDFEAREDPGMGSGWAISYYACLSEMTRERAEYLERWYKLLSKESK